MAEHGVEFVQRIQPLAEYGLRHAHGGGDLYDLAIALRQEFVQRRIKQADRHR